MIQRIKFWIIPLLLYTACTQNPSSSQNSAVDDSSSSFSFLNPEGKTVEERFPTPPGFTRIKGDSTSFTKYLRTLQLKPHGSEVMLYNGSPKFYQGAHAAIITMDVGKSDLQQCADAVMRLRAEYLFHSGQKDKISFRYTNGFEVPWKKYAEGYRVKVSGNKTNWVKSAEANSSYATFRKYMDNIFMYAGSLSLSKELDKAELSNIVPGNVFILGGSPGHAVIVIDVAINDKTGERIFMLAQSYMPAQEIHILKNPANEDENNPWYSTQFEGSLQTPEWSFEKDQLKKFREQ